LSPEKAEMIRFTPGNNPIVLLD